MWHGKSKIFDEFRAEIDNISVIETHEHNVGVCPASNDLDIIAFISQSSYYPSDLTSSSFGFGIDRHGSFPVGALRSYLENTSISFDERYSIWEKFHNKTCHTAYAKGLFEGLKACWGIKDYKKKTLLGLQEKMRSERSQKFFDSKYQEYRIETMIVNTDINGIINDTVEYNKNLCRFVFPLPEYHAIFTAAGIRKPHLEKIIGKAIVSLDDYLTAFEEFLKQCIDFGIAGIKDQTAYRREISYDMPSRGQAENIFNKIVSHPRDTFGTEQVKPLDDYLFHQFMIMAAKYKLPVQIHTGHMAGIRNEISKTNPVHLSNVLELHQDVVFDLFHAGWPYMGEFLFLGKNYPNVMLDMCWAHAIDPLYCVELLKRAIMTVPHSKILGFGGDTRCVECQIGYLIQAKDNIAIALSDLIDSGWLGMDDAVQIAKDILYNNPKRIFSL